MAPASRIRPFVLTFHPCGAEQDPGQFKTRVIPINTAPVEIENAHFKGAVMLIHDTGNEPGPASENKDPSERRGVELQIQGKFKKTVERGGESTHGLWVGGELPEVLKLGWIMQNVVQLCMKYARKKTEGRVFFTLGNKTENPHLSFPIGQLFTCITTPPGSTPPQLGSMELRGIKWPGPGWIDVSSENTYTLLYKTPYLDLCSWELLKVPGVSPLGIESILGDLTTARVMMFDLGVAGAHQNWRKGALLEWVLTRGAEGDEWLKEDEPVTESPARILVADDNEDEVDDDAEEQEMEAEGDEEDALVAVDDQQDDVATSSSASSDTIDDPEEEEEMSKADSQALLDIAGWRPRNVAVENALVRVPYYIEAIDRRRRRKVRAWYVMEIAAESGEDWWHAKAATELASLCRPKRRLGTFRRGPGARRYTCHAIKTLEQFRHIVCQQLAGDTKLRYVVMRAAAEAEASPGGVVEDRRGSSFEDLSPSGLTPARIARKLRRHGPLLPPRFFVGSGSACSLAFLRASEGRKEVARETLVGAVHFEGRLCEELMRLSTDGTIRCFTPYDCDKPRVMLRAAQLLSVHAVDGLFLGRFHLFEVSTVLREFVFCSHDAKDRDEWVLAIQGIIEAAKAPITDMIKVESTKEPLCSTSALPMPSTIALPATLAMPPAADTKVAALDKFSVSVNGASIVSKVNSTFHKSINLVNLRKLREPGVSDWATQLTDCTRARRWRNPRRLVLNDRLLVADSTPPPPPTIAEHLLEQVLRLPQPASSEDMIAFTNLTCKLKAVRFAGWSQQELIAFWLNVFHCLLLHGWALLGRPTSRTELKRFYLRVSYLVGLRPVSLWEIERAILRVPHLDKQRVVRAQAGARARQLLGFCSLCRRRLQGAPATKQGNEADKKNNASPRSNSTQASAAGRKVLNSKPKACLPMPALPTPPWKTVGHHACLYLGKEQDHLVLPKQEHRCLLCLNRGTYACLPEIPVFHASRLDMELDEAARKVMATFMEVEVRDGRLVRVSAPEICKALGQELGGESKAILKFLLQFRSGDVAPTPGTRLKFYKGNEEPRHLAEMQKLVWTDPKLLTAVDEPPLSKELTTSVGSAQALARLVVRKDHHPGGDAYETEETDVEGLEALVAPAGIVPGGIMRL